MDRFNDCGKCIHNPVCNIKEMYEQSIKDMASIKKLSSYFSFSVFCDQFKQDTPTQKTVHFNK